MSKPNIAGSPPPIKAFYQKWKVDNRERIAEWYRRYFHTGAVSILMIFNLMFAYSAVIIYFSRWKHQAGDPRVFLSFFMDDPSFWLIFVTDLFFFRIDTYHPFWMLVIFFLPLFNWFYSTITQPIKKGYKTIISWTSEKGRKWACILSAIPWMFLFCAINAWYTDVYLFSYFDGVRVDKDFLVVKSMTSLGYILMLLPVFLCLIGVYQVLRQFYIFEDLRKQFYTWEFSLLAKQSFSLKDDKCDVILGWDKKTNKPMILNESSRMLHELVTGPTGSGKTSTTILIRIVQDLVRIARGVRTGVCLLEPKGDAVRDVLKLAKKLGIPDEKIIVIDPTDLVKSTKFNPFAGPLEAAAETFRGVLDALTGDQDEFFKGQQNETAAAYTMLGKLRYGNLFNITHMQRMYTDPRYLATMTEEVRNWIDTNLNNPNLTPEDRQNIDRYDRVCKYFEDEVLEYKTYKNKEGDTVPATYSENHRYAGQQIVENKKDKFITGAKKYLNDIAMNAMLSNLMVANDGEKTLNIDQFLEEGGLLLVNSALGELEELSLMLGQFFIRQFQSSVFRRPPEEGEYKRIPIFFYVDEYPLYGNESFERMLTLGRSYKVGTLIAIQSLGQLTKVMPGHDQVIMSNARNRTVFGGGVYEDNKAFSDQFGEEYEIEESMNESTTPVTMPNQTWGYRYNTARTLMARFSPTDIMELPFKHFIVQLVNEDGSINPPVLCYGKFVNETKFLKNFLNIGKITLETREYKPLGIQSYLNFYKTLISKSLEEKGIEAKVEDINKAIPTNNQEVEILPPANPNIDANLERTDGSGAETLDNQKRSQNNKASSTKEDTIVDEGDSQEPTINPTTNTVEPKVNNGLEEKEDDPLNFDDAFLGDNEPSDVEIVDPVEVQPNPHAATSTKHDKLHLLMDLVATNPTITNIENPSEPIHQIKENVESEKEEIQESTNDEKYTTPTNTHSIPNPEIVASVDELIKTIETDQSLISTLPERAKEESSSDPDLHTAVDANPLENSSLDRSKESSHKRYAAEAIKKFNEIEEEDI